MSAQNNKDKVVVFFPKKDRKIIGNSTDDEFFEYVDLAKIKYFTRDKVTQTIKCHEIVDSIKHLTKLQKKLVLRDIVLMGLANEMGYIGVDWDRFFAQPHKTLVALARTSYDLIKEHHPSLIIAWDETQKNEAEEKYKQEQELIKKNKKKQQGLEL